MIRDLYSLFGKNKYKVKKSLLFLLLHSFISIVPLFIIFLFILEFFKSSISISNLIYFTVFLAGTYIVFNSLEHHIYLYFMNLGLDISYDLRLDIGKKLTELHLGFFNISTLGEINTIISEYVSKVEYFITYTAPFMVSSIITVVLLSMIFFILDWRIAICSSMVFPLSYLSFKHSDKVSKIVVKNREKSLIKYNSAIVEFIRGINIIKIYNLNSKQFKKFHLATKDFRDKNIENVKATMIPNIFVLFFASISVIILFPIGIYLYITKSISLFKIIFFFIATPSISSAMADCLFGYIHLKNHVGYGVNCINNLMDEKIISENKNEVKLNNYDIKISEVTFAYENEKVLNNISFKCNEKTLTALVGPSGSGKTTMINLILRFWDVQEGSIVIGGYDIKEMPLKQLSDIISIVFQDVFLFDASLKDNIKMAKKNATDEEIIKASKDAMCHEFIEKLPNGYDTIVGENGSKLSEGEKQRISIARAILKDSPIIILDEPTSSLDAENEYLIQKAIEKMIKSKTVIMIAHRLHTISSADQIIFLKKGEIFEKGTHNELMDKKGHYYNFWNIQEKVREWKF